MKIRFWGVRGSIPAPGPETNRYGGNTSCVSITTSTGRLIIIDMGTALMHLGNSLMPGPFGKRQGSATILLSHTHWDHIQGMSFFPPVYVNGHRFLVLGPGGPHRAVDDTLYGPHNANLLQPY